MDSRLGEIFSTFMDAAGHDEEPRYGGVGLIKGNVRTGKVELHFPLPPGPVPEGATIGIELEPEWAEEMAQKLIAAAHGVRGQVP